MSVLSQQLSLHISYMSGPSQKNLLASFSIGCLEVALQKYSVKAKQKKDGRNFSHCFLTPLSSSLKQGLSEEGQTDWEIISHSNSGFQGSTRDVFALHGNKILLLRLPGYKVPSGAAQPFGASE